MSRNHSYPKDCLYKTLGVSSNAPLTEIFSTFQRRHAELKGRATGGNKENIEKDINSLWEAYLVLYEPTKREKYDRFRKMKKSVHVENGTGMERKSRSSQSSPSSETKIGLSGSDSDSDTKSEMDLDTWAQLID